MGKFLFLAIALLNAHVFGYELFQFLERRPLAVVGKINEFSTLANTTLINDESYVVIDAWGNSYFLIARRPERSMVHLAVQKLATALGLYPVPVRPILIKRGQYGIPSLEEAGRRGGPINNTFTADQWFPGLITPAMPMEVRPPDEALSFSQIEELTQITIVAYVLRAAGSNYRVKGGHFLPLGFNWLFWSQREKKVQQLLKNYFAAVPWKRLQAFSPEQARNFSDHLGQFFDRLEILSRDHFETVFGLVVDANLMMEEERGSRNSLDVANSLRKNIQSARSEIAEYLRTRIGRSFKDIRFEQKPHGIGDLVISPIDYDFRWSIEKAPSIASQSVRNGNAKKLLFGYYMARPSIREKLYAKWSSDLNGADPIDMLLRDAEARDSTIHFVSNDPVAVLHERGLSGPPQFYLPTKAPKTLVVYANNDREGELIDTIVSEMKSQLAVVPFRLDGVTHNYRLTSSDVENIVKSASALECRRVIICELGGIANSDRVLFPESLELLQLDHHNGTWQKFSTVEQLMQIYNYQPNLRQLVVAMLDRSNIFAFPDLGFKTIEPVIKLLTSLRLFDRFDDKGLEVGHFTRTDPSSIMHIRNHQGSLKPLAGALGLTTYPEVPTFIATMGGLVIVYGKAERIWRVAEHYKGTRVSVLGGDGSKVMFVSIKSQYDDVASIKRSVERLLTEEPHQGVSSKCGTEIETQGMANH
ncbi:MAG: hypothetical protein HY537_02095 [Deltaproteobacteria bacterium]|nr:hypothetical protein [Deltaproteobacteria bacterium]